MRIAELIRIEPAINILYIAEKAGLKPEILENKIHKNEELTEEQASKIEAVLDEIGIKLTEQFAERKRKIELLENINKLDSKLFPKNTTFDRKYIYRGTKRGT
jgi:hypothetical protein